MLYTIGSSCPISVTMIAKDKLSLLVAAPDSIAKRRIYSEGFVNQRSWELNICLVGTLKEMVERLMQTKVALLKASMFKLAW